MAFIERFSQTVKGDLVFTGNTLGLSKRENENSAGKVGSIGAFIILDENEQVNSFPKGTSLDYLKNSSSALLSLPPFSQVLYAELVWSGVYKSKSKDISKNLSKPISFITPKGKYDISAEYRTKQNCNIDLQGYSLGIYSRSANVTTFVQQAMSGTYSVGKVPTIIDPLDEETNKTNFAGWTLVVAYKNNKMSPKLLNFKVGCEIVYSTLGNIDVAMKGFIIPLRGPGETKVLISAGEGDNEISGDTLSIGNDAKQFVKLKGLNNDENNFFASQINNSLGHINTTGTFGYLNHDSKTHLNIDAGRQGYDITTIDIKKEISSNINNPILRFNSTGDLYAVNAVGLAVDSAGACIKVEKTADKQHIVSGDLITYTIDITNVGDILAEDVVLFDALPYGVKCENNSIKVDGKSYTGKFPIVMSNLNPNEKHTVTFKVRVDSQKCKTLKNIAKVKYNYNLSGVLIKEESFSNTLCLTPEGETDKVKIKKSVDKSVANKNDILKYTTVITNISDIELTDIIFIDEVPNGTSFIEGSVFIDGINFEEYDPNIGFVLGSLKPRENIAVVFSVIIL